MVCEELEGRSSSLVSDAAFRRSDSTRTRSKTTDHALRLHQQQSMARILAVHALLVALFCTFATAFFASRGLTSSRTTPSGMRLYHTYSPKETAQAHIKASKIVVFSKTHCPYCKKAKEAIAALTPMFSVIELDVIKDGAEQQAALLELTGQKTVPNIFVSGQHIGGCDNTLAAIASGEFQKLIAA